MQLLQGHNVRGEWIIKYQFSIKKNIYMYNHLITCVYGADKYKAICESAPSKEETIIF